MSASESDLKKDLEAAFEQHTPEADQETGGSAAPDTTEPVRDSTPAEGQTVAEGKGEGQPLEGLDSQDGERDQQGRFKPKDASKPDGTQPPDTAAAKEPAAAAPEPIGPPAGWKPTAREHWSKIPKQAQEEIVRREKEAAQVVRQSAQARQLSNDFQTVVNPFLPMIQAQGSNPMQAVKNLMTTAAGLTVGTQEQKARIVREIIQNYGIDIQTLDAVLSGQPLQQQQNPGQQNQLAPPPWAQPIFQFMNGVQHTRQQREQQILADAESQTEQFASKHEFFEDVREDMADIMEMAARRGVSMTLEQAYEKTLALNPELSSIVNQRKAAQRAGSSNIQRNRNAASSITGAPKNGPAGAPQGGDDRRSALAEAWDSQNNR
jgi:hypothetical protein